MKFKVMHIEQFSSYSAEEVFFNPYSSFSIKKILREADLIKIVLESLEKYKEVIKKAL